MIDSPNHNDKSNEINEFSLLKIFHDEKIWCNFLRWVIYCFLLTFGIGLSYSWYFLTQKLSPVVETELTNLLNRPIKLGKVEWISFSGVGFGESEIPVTTTDSDYISVKAMEIKINPLQLIARKKLELKLSLIQPNIYVEQDDNSTWIDTKFKKANSQWNGIEINLQSINFDDTNLTLKAKSKKGNIQPDVKIKLNSSNVYFNPNLIKFDSEGKFIQGGKIELNGFYNNSQQQLDLLINSQEVSATEINNLLPLPLQLHSGKINSNLHLNLNANEKLNITGKSTLNKVTLNIPKLSQPLTKTSGEITFFPYGLTIDNAQTNFGLIPTKVKGLINYNGQISLQGNTPSINFDKVLHSLNLPKPALPITGEVKANLQVTGLLNKPRLTTQLVTTNKATLDKIKLKFAQANLDLSNSQLTVKNLTLIPAIGGQIISQGNVSLDNDKPEFLFNINADNISGQKVATIYEQKTPIEIGNISGKYKVTGSWKQANLSQITGTSKIEVAGGEAIISNLKHNQQNWQANLDFSEINLAKIVNHNVCQKIQCNNSQISGSFTVSGNNKTITPITIKAKGDANLNLAGDIIQFKNLLLNNGKWQTLMTTEKLDIAKIHPNYSTLLKGKINSNLNIAGNLENFNQIIAYGNGNLILPQGKIALENLQLKENNFRTEVISNSLDLKGFSSELKGEASGKLNVTGDINNLTLNQVKISGDVGFSEGIGLIKQPLQTAFNWDGKKLFINEADSNGMKAKGVIDFNLATKQINNFNLDILADNIDLKSLPFSLPSQVSLLQYQGKFDFNGQVFGSLENPNLVGDISLNNFAVSNFKFNPLEGKIVAKTNEGINLNLREKRNKGDVIKISLNSEYQPQDINIQVENTAITGLNQNDIFSLSLENLSLGKVAQPFLSLLPSSVKNLDGKISAKVNINLNNYNFIAPEITIQNPVIGKFKGDSITSNLTYSQGKLNINQGKITKKNSNYLFAGEIYPLAKNPQFQANFNVESGNIQDLLESVEVFNWADLKKGITAANYGTAKDLYPQNEQNYSSNSPPPLVSVGKQNTSLENQLNEFNQISELVTQKQGEKLASSLPELEELKGNFDGSLAVSGSLEKGIEAAFDFEGKNWNWGRYQVDSIQTKGTYKDGLLTFVPIKIQQKETIFSLLGSFNKERLSGQIIVVNLPVNEVQKVVFLPDFIGLGGMLNANIAISGSEENPLAKGEININNGTINQTKIKSNQASFSYKNSRLNFFASSIFADNIQPLTIKGSFPYQLFPNSIHPESNQFDISLKIKDKIFPLLDTVTNNQIKWLQGEGNINLDIQGNYNQEKNQLTNIETQGIATLQNGIISANIFPKQPLTDINGKILFNFDQIKVENLTGKFSGGNINITGSLPLIKKVTQVNPLTFNFDNLALNLDELYQGGVNGNIQITGSVIAPKLTGNLELFNGEISLSPEKTNNNKPEKSANLSATEFKNLTLILGNNIRITKAPILSVMAKGNLILSGSINQPKPSGNIYLTDGKLNLFTSQLKLAKDHKNIAKFTTENGLDPYLDIQLLASVTETNRHQFVSSPMASEIQDISNSEAGKAQTIRVKANIKGLSSQLRNKLELKSSPQRSESEIIALLGGGFLNNFAEGNSSLGLANLASSAFLGSFQGQIGDALGLSEFRLFPTQIIDSEKRTSTLNLGAEIGIDIGSNFSISIMKILTNEQVPQYSIRYRLNDKTLLRGSSDFGSDNRGSIEFEKRF